MLSCGATEYSNLFQKSGVKQVPPAQNCLVASHSASSALDSLLRVWRENQFPAALPAEIAWHSMNQRIAAIKFT